MTRLIWTDDLNTGIPEIDNQHKRILEFINRLQELVGAGQARFPNSVTNSFILSPLFPPEGTEIKALLATIEDILDYTLTHFVFEEALMEEAAYPYYAAHKAIHDSFRHRITEYRALLEAGENVAGELLHMLTSWLFNHIRHDDSVMADSLLQRQESVRSSTPRRLASAMGLLGKPVPGTDVRIS